MLATVISVVVIWKFPVSIHWRFAHAQFFLNRVVITAQKKTVSCLFPLTKEPPSLVVYVCVLQLMAESWDPIAAVEPPAVEIKLFGKWNPDEVQVGDISLQVWQL